MDAAALQLRLLEALGCASWPVITSWVLGWLKQVQDLLLRQASATKAGIWNEATSHRYAPEVVLQSAGPLRGRP